jgi:pSer/pThr/pTyr-binding forkhead associated (FHA) protein
MANLPEPGRTGPLAALALTAGPRYGEELPIPKPIVTVGRAAASDVVIDDDSVSAAHARLEWDLGAWRITDLGSTNGTAVEGIKLAPNIPTPLPYGATVRVGGVKLQFREVAQANPERARAEYVAPEKPATLREERSGFRFPVWLALLLLVLLVVIGFLVFQSMSTPVRVGGAPAHPVLALASWAAAP